MSSRPGRRAQVDQARWRQVREVLCVRLDTIGDVLMSGPAMRALRERARVTLLTSAAGAAVARLMPEVHETIVYAAPWIKRSEGNLRSGHPDETEPGRELGDDERGRDLIERLRARRFDGAVIFTVYSQSALPAALLCLLAGIPLRLAHSREKPYALLTDWVPETEPQQRLRHEVRRQLDLVAAIGARAQGDELRLAIPAAARARAGRKLAEAGLTGEPFLAVHPGGTAPARRYPPDLLADACGRLAGGPGIPLLFTGDADDLGLIDDVRARIGRPSSSLAGELGLGELAAVLNAAGALLCGNTGPAHIAAAVGTPVVDLYALTNPQHTPWRVPSRVLFHEVPCRWCYSSVCPEGHHLCLRGIPPDEVAAAVLELLERPKPGAYGVGSRQVAAWAPGLARTA